MTELNETLDRQVTICAPRETVFRYFTDSERFAGWWGEGSRIEGRPGGAMHIRYPDGQTASGEVREIEPPRRIVFTFVMAGQTPSEVTITLEEVKQGTLLRLHHAFSSAKIRDHFVQGWRYQLALFSKTVSAEVHAKAAERVDAYLAAWGNPDAAARKSLLSSCAAPHIEFRDAYSSTSGLDDLLAHLDAVQVYMPGMTLSRDGDVRVSHGTAIAGWKATKQDSSPSGKGVNVYDFAPDGRITRVVGFWES
jgi:uncharacterized protein YndB with AHSA1/START domain